ncbi:MAG TPA: TetR/AcrR family transcriptional regulator [Eubacteriaceae bacterium]|nr:TetR/AcrR family transcriptional regulator [Eubacteriaceae bacterium]
MKTREKIIYEALSLFSVHGYDAVTIREIASKVGIKESSIYNHFKNKQDILNKIIEETLKRYYSTLENVKVPESEDDNVSELYDNITDDTFLDICTKIFLFYLKDDYISKLRRLLTIEQYGNEEIGETFRYVFIDRVLETQRQVLQKFIDSGRFIQGDAYTMALHFYSPVFLLLYKYDNCPENEEQAIMELKMHVSQYNAIYRRNSIEREERNL